MIWFKLSEDLLINLEHIYILSKSNNEANINEWEELYDSYLSELTNKPIPFTIDDEEYIPNFEEYNDPDKLEKYMKRLNEYIINCIGVKPKYEEQYYTILNTGNKIFISKDVYDILKEKLENML